MDKKVLLVDYDAQSVAALSQMLSTRPLKLLTASDGQAAYDLFVKEKPDLVVLEAILPRIHGFDLTKRITQESEGRVPVIVVTGLYRGPQYRHEALTTLGAAEYFEKPVDPERFLATVTQLLQDDDEIGEDLPGADEVIAKLSKRVKGQPR